MVNYLLHRGLSLLITLLVAATLTFTLMKLAPGDPFSQDQPLPEEILKAMNAHYGLDQPPWKQYLNYLKGLSSFNFGPSFTYQGRDVNAIIKEGFPVSACLGLEALFLALGSGLFLGTLASLKKGRWQDQGAMILAILGISVPSFILATLLQYFFSMQLSLLPVARWGTFQQSILPAFSLAALPAAFIARLMRTNTLEVFEQDYILMAKAKGLSSFQICVKHVLKNALLPIASYLGPLFAGIMTGSFVIEKIFGIPGLGQWFVLSVLNRDYTLIMGLTVFYSVLLMTSVTIIDLVYTLIDPRIKLYGKHLLDT